MWGVEQIIIMKCLYNIFMLFAMKVISTIPRNDCFFEATTVEKYILFSCKS